jgi:hypothetical protein
MLNLPPHEKVPETLAARNAVCIHVPEKWHCPQSLSQPGL